MTKVVIVGDMTFGEAGPPPGVVTPPIAGQPPVAGQLPVFPASPDQGLPPIPGVPLPPINLPPGEIWPPLPPGTPEPHKAVAIVAIPGVGYRYTVVELKPGHPDHGLPSDPPRPGHELPPSPEPKRR